MDRPGISPKLKIAASNSAKWFADWLAALEHDCPNPLDRMRRLAQECASERYWNERRDAFQEWREAKRTASEDEHLAHKFYCLACFSDSELYRLLTQYCPDLLSDFGPNSENDETFTAKERAERCHNVYSKLTASKQKRDAELSSEPPSSPDEDSLEVKDLANSDRNASFAVLRVFTNGVVDDRIKKAALILSNTMLTANEKLTKIDALIRFPATASAEQLGGMLCVTKQAVLKTEWWRENRKGEKESEIGRRRTGHRNRAKDYEPPATKDADE